MKTLIPFLLYGLVCLAVGAVIGRQTAPKPSAVAPRLATATPRDQSFDLEMLCFAQLASLDTDATVIKTFEETKKLVKSWDDIGQGWMTQSERLKDWLKATDDKHPLAFQAEKMRHSFEFYAKRLTDEAKSGDARLFGEYVKSLKADAAALMELAKAH